MKTKKVKIEILRSFDKESFEVYIDGNRAPSAMEFQIICIIGIEYLSQRIH